MNKDQKLLEEAYRSICESLKEPLYFGPPEMRRACLEWLEELDHEVHEDGSVSVEGHANFFDTHLGRIPFNFKKVTGSFVCHNCGIASLEGAPEEVGGDFLCSFNMIRTLKGAPEKVEGDFTCFNTNKKFQLASLEGAPEVIGGEFSSDKFSDEDYRNFARKRKYVDGKLDKEFDIDLGDF
jgi:hypothetical protein